MLSQQVLLLLIAFIGLVVLFAQLKMFSVDTTLREILQVQREILEELEIARRDRHAESHEE